MNEKNKNKNKMQGGHKLTHQHKGVAIIERNLFSLVDTEKCQ